jgi:hypothetical protein
MRAIRGCCARFLAAVKASFRPKTGDKSKELTINPVQFFAKG